MCPPHKACAVQDMFCFAALAEATLGTMYTNINGAFPIWSFKNMQYIFVTYIYNLNAIIMQPMPSCTDSLFITAFSKNVRDNLCLGLPASTECDRQQVLQKRLRSTSEPTRWTSSWSHHTTTVSMLRNLPFPRLKSTLLLPLPLLTCFAPYSFGTNFYHKSNLHSTFYNSHIVTYEFQSARYFTACSIFTKCSLPLSGQKHWFTMIPQQEPPGRRMQMTGSTFVGRRGTN
jgi:hypothetical protein